MTLYDFFYYIFAEAEELVITASLDGDGCSVWMSVTGNDVSNMLRKLAEFLHTSGYTEAVELPMKLDNNSGMIKIDFSKIDFEKLGLNKNQEIELLDKAYDDFMAESFWPKLDELLKEEFIEPDSEMEDKEREEALESYKRVMAKIKQKKAGEENNEN